MEMRIAVKKEVQWIDVPVLLKCGMTGWPSDPPDELSAFASIKSGNHSNVLRLSLGS